MNGFLPDTLLGWIVVTGFVGGIVSSLYALFIKKLVWTPLLEKINAVGKRVNEVRDADIKFRTETQNKYAELDRLEDSLKDMKREQAYLTEKATEAKSATDACLDENRTTFKEIRDFLSQMDRRLVRIETKLNGNLND